MRAIAPPQHEPELERDEREADAVVLLDVPALVRPERVAWLVRADDDVTEGDRRVAADRDEQVGEAAIRDVQETAVSHARSGERQDADEMPERVGMMSCERADQIS